MGSLQLDSSLMAKLAKGILFPTCLTPETLVVSEVRHRIYKTKSVWKKKK